MNSPFTEMTSGIWNRNIPQNLPAYIAAQFIYRILNLFSYKTYLEKKTSSSEPGNPLVFHYSFHIAAGLSSLVSSQLIACSW